MKLDNLGTLDEMASFINGTQSIAFAVATKKDERYQCVKGILKRFNYAHCKRKEKGIIIQFLMKISGYSRQQLTRMIKRYVETGQLKPHQRTTRGFSAHYTAEDVKLLAELDRRHDTPNGLRVKKPLVSFKLY